MGDKKQGAKVQKSLSGFARGLMATTALTVACGGSALATTISEGSIPAPSDFPGFSNGFLLPVGTNVVNGFVGQLSGERGFDDEDWFEFQGLGAGTFTLSASSNVEGLPSIYFNVFTDSGTPLATEVGFFGSPITITSGSIPLDGKLVVGVFQGEEIGGNYTVTLNTASSGVPEPATFGLTGLALATGALAWRRKRNQ